MTRSTQDTAAAIVREARGLVGASTPVVRAVRHRYSKLLARESPERVLAIANVVLAEGTWTARVLAFELLASHPSAMSRLSSRLVESMAGELGDWGSVDLFAVTVSGAAWRQGRISDAQVARWARSSNRWLRRLALVSTVPLNSKARGGAGDTARTLAVGRMLVADRDPMVVTALSWALRELSKRDPDSVAAFLKREETQLASLVRREVRTKLETGRKVRPASPKKRL